jgi:hypothetical protein
MVLSLKMQGNQEESEQRGLVGLPQFTSVEAYPSIRSVLHDHPVFIKPKNKLGAGGSCL